MPLKIFSRIKTTTQLYISFAFFSIVLAGFISLHLKFSNLGYKLIPEFKKSVSESYYAKYHDFDRDGVDEFITWNYEQYVTKYEIQVYEENSGLIDQFNFSEYTTPSWTLFDDYNGDDYDELFVFTCGNDSLFLYVVDIQQRKFLKRREFLLKAPENYPNKKWDILVHPASQLYINKNNKKELVFCVTAGFAIYPRSVYIYDLKKSKMRVEFKTLASLHKPFFFDLNDDGKNEIIVSSGASDNVHFETKYSDQYSWLFVLDQKLRLLFPAFRLSKYPGSLYVSPFRINKKSYLLTYSYYKGEKNIPGTLSLINHHGKKVKAVTIGKIRGSLIVDQLKDDTVFYLRTSHNGLFKFNSNFDIITRNNSLSQIHNPILENLIGDRKNELLAVKHNKVILINDQLELLARYEIDDKKIKNFSIKRSGVNSPKQIFVQGTSGLYEFQIKKNKIYSFIYLIFLGLCAVNFSVMVLVYKLLSIILIYWSAVQNSLKKSSNGIMILNGKGEVVYVNGRFQTILNLERQVMQKQNYADALQEINELKNQVEYTIQNKKASSRDITLNKENKLLKLQINVSSLPINFPIIDAYLVEIRDITELVLSDRAKIWNRSIQKIAHDIKTPLSTIQLNLKTLQMHLAKISPEDREEIDDDINMMRSELERVRNMTKNFLKYSNLEIPNFQAVNLQAVIEKALSQFDDYINGDLKIECEIEPNLNDVWLDPQQIEMALHIIIENALDALKGKGLINVSTTMAQYLDKCFFKDFVEIEIADTGEGIDAEIKDKIFEPYFTTKKDGTGMGLAIARKIIEDHNGKIDIYSKDGFGTVVRFSVPIFAE